MPELIYLDTNVYCRPMDDQDVAGHRKETEAFLKIQELADQGNLEVLGSDILQYEVTKNLEKKCRLGGRDALHIAAAVLGNARRFLTCDKNVVKKSKRINAALHSLNREIIVENPVHFMQTYKER